eukprot:TRINITY_DN339_c0_g1_i1.p1 TRINITY_DN339_c0_g1~~TRINITY_DN339_c0_g1_i1.p1  ORF type:complete len:829 (+),score=106.76 TRINITY_DN339_c0_g1_i1:78-2564(+)
MQPAGQARFASDSHGSSQMKQPARTCNSTSKQGYPGMQNNSNPTTETSPQVTAEIVEESLKSERMWWSEASRRQIEDVQVQLSEDMQRSTGKLRSDIAALQDHVELLVENEKQQRHQALADLRRESDGHQVNISDLKHHYLSLNGKIGELLADRQQKVSVLARDSVDDKNQDKLLGRQRDEISNLQKQLTSQFATEFQELRRQLSQMQRDVDAVKGENDARRSVIDDWVVELRNGTEENKLELVRVREGLKDIERTQPNTSLEETRSLRESLMQTSAELAKGIEEVASSVCHIKRALDTSSQEAKQEVEEERCKRCDEIASLRSRLESLREQVQEDAGCAKERLHRFEDRISQELEVERSARAAEIVDVKLHVDSIGRRSTARDEVSVVGSAGSVDETTQHRLEQDMQAIREQIASLRLALQTNEAETRRSAASAARAEGEIQSVSERLNKTVGLGSRVDALEEDVRQAVRDHDIRRLDRDLQRIANDLSPLSLQIDDVRTEYRKSIREVVSDVNYVSTTVAAVASQVEAMKEHYMPHSFGSASKTACSTPSGFSYSASLQGRGSATGWTGRSGASSPTPRSPVRSNALSSLNDLGMSRRAIPAANKDGMSDLTQTMLSLVNKVKQASSGDVGMEAAGRKSRTVEVRSPRESTTTLKRLSDGNATDIDQKDGSIISNARMAFSSISSPPPPLHTQLKRTAVSSTDNAREEALTQTNGLRVERSDKRSLSPLRHDGVEDFGGRAEILPLTLGSQSGTATPATSRQTTVRTFQTFQRGARSASPPGVSLPLQAPLIQGPHQVGLRSSQPILQARPSGGAAPLGLLSRQRR